MPAFFVMKKLCFIIPLAVYILLHSCSSTKSNIDDLAWLQGSWQSLDKNNYYEVWLYDNNQLKGISYTFQNNALVPAEYLTISANEVGDLIYIAQVTNQGQAIPFTLRHQTSNKWVFENKKHDFPERITYFKQAGNSVRIVVDGKIEGKYIKQEWLLQKMNGLNLR